MGWKKGAFRAAFEIQGDSPPAPHIQHPAVSQECPAVAGLWGSVLEHCFYRRIWFDVKIAPDRRDPCIRDRLL